MDSQITGFNHVLLITKKMNETVDMFVNVLGFKVKGTTRRTMNEYPAGEAGLDGVAVQRLYFLQMPDTSMVVVAEVPTIETPEVRPCLPAYWPDVSYADPHLGKIDHLALNVKSRADLAFFRDRLREHGHEVSEINERMGDPKFVKSIYFHSPDGMPMEICTWDFDDPEWETAKHANYMRDPDPVPALTGH